MDAAIQLDALWDAPVGLALFDSDLRYVRVNAALETINGVSAADHIGKTVLEVLPEQNPEVPKQIQRVRDTGVPLDVEVAGSTPRAPGVLRHWRASYYPVRRGDEVVGVGATFLEITRQKHTEDALREALAEAEQRGALLDAMMEHIPMGITIAHAPDVKIRAVSRYGRELLEKTSEELTGMPAEQHPQAWAVFRADGLTPASADELPLTRATTHGEVIRGEEWVVTRKDGVKIPILCTAAPIRDRQGRITGGVIGWQDLTERLRAEKSLREVAARYERQVRLFEGVASTTPDFVYLFDREGRFLYANRRLLEVWGMQLPNVVGKTCRELGYEQWHHDMHMREIAQVIETKRPIKGEVPFKAPLTGLFGIYEYIFTPVIGPDGKVEIIAGTTRDVTDRKRAEDALREADRRKDEFLGMLSHELRNPLAPIRNSVYLLNRQDSSDEQAGRARLVIERQVDHLTRLVDDLLDVTRIARGKIELRRDRLDLKDVVRRTGEDHRSLMEDRGLKLTIDVPDDHLWVDGDATRLTQAIGNLLANAAKFTNRGGNVLLSTRGVEGAAEVTVRDTGAGIEPDLLPHVFEPFVQGYRTLARSSGGLGLGLALVKGLVDLHGGSVAVRSAGASTGAEFTIRVPLLVTVTAAHEKRGDAPAAARRRRRRVLVVDDNADAAESLAELASLWGHEAEVAHDGPTAIEKARANPPDVILCDIGLPGMDGYEVARVLRADPRLSGTHFVAVSGYAQPDDLRIAAEAGFDQHVAKPPSPEEIERLLA